MASSVFLFTGEEKYLLHQELQRWKQGFLEKFGPDALFVFDAQNTDFSVVKQAIYAGGLFVSKKMVILFGIPTDGDTSNKQSAAFLEKFTEEFIVSKGVVPEDTLLVFVSYKADKRTKLYSLLKDIATIKQFDSPKDRELIAFVREHFTVQISDASIAYFLEKVGSDLYHILHECEKLNIWCEVHGVKTIDTSLIDLVSFGLVESNNFAFFDVLLSDRKTALILLQKAQEEGANRNMFSGTLYWGIKLWLLCLDLFDSGVTDSKILASMLKAHPFVISKMVKHMAEIRRHRVQISDFYQRLIELEFAIKTGKTPDSLFWLEVKRLLVTLF